MKIHQHPRMLDVVIGDEVFSYEHRVFARVEEVFPSAVCVKIARMSTNCYLDIDIEPQLWAADDIENLSICRYCGARDDLSLENATGLPFRVCPECSNTVVRHSPQETGVWW